MRFAVLCAGLWIAGVSALAQSTGTSPDAEIVRQATLYSIDTGAGVWQHEPVDACPAFTRHTFVLYRRSPEAGVRTSFMAIVSHPDGNVVLVPLTGSITGDNVDAAGRRSTVKLFNLIWQDELKAHGTPFPGLTWGGLGDCYARIAGEQPISIPEPGRVIPPPAITLTQHVLRVNIPVVAPAGQTRAVGIGIDPLGMLDQAVVTATVPRIVPPPEKPEEHVVPAPSKLQERVVPAQR